MKRLTRVICVLSSVSIAITHGQPTLAIDQADQTTSKRSQSRSQTYNLSWCNYEFSSLFEYEIYDESGPDLEACVRLNSPDALYYIAWKEWDLAEAARRSQDTPSALQHYKNAQGYALRAQRAGHSDGGRLAGLAGDQYRLQQRIAELKSQLQERQSRIDNYEGTQRERQELIDERARMQERLKRACASKREARTINSEEANICQQNGF